MPIDVALYQKEINGRTYAFDTGDISFGDAGTKDVLRNTGIDIVSVQLRKRQVTFTIRGATGADLANLYAERDNNIIQLLTSTTVLGEDIQIGQDTIYKALLLDVQSGPPITVAGQALIESIQLRYDSQVYV